MWNHLVGGLASSRSSIDFLSEFFRHCVTAEEVAGPHALALTTLLLGYSSSGGLRKYC